MVTLQQNSSSMEETVRTLLQNQDSVEGPRVDPLDLMKAYKDKLLEEMWKQQDSLEGPTFTAEQTDTSLEAGGGPEETSKDNNPLLERLRALEAENSALSTENDNQRKQYERCLDEVANQVVQALLTQKNLKEECVKLRTRVFDLEQQNRILSLLFQQRVKLSAVPVSQEVQRNGKAGFPAGQWPSLLSLTCPRSSGSGSQLSLSSAGSEHSSGSHTWADGRGFSKQCASNRDKRLSTGSVSSNHSASVEQADLGWKEGHVLKGLKRLQMNRSKKASSQASVSHCKDCMTSNEGIYSPGVRSCQQAAAAKQEEATGEGFRADPGTETLDSDDPDDESSKGLNRESSDPPIKDQLYLDTLDLNKDEDRNLPDSVSLSADSGLFPSPDSENFLFLESPTLKPGVSPTDSLTHLEETDKNSLGKLKASGFRFSDRNNNQERSTDRKSRLDYNKGQGRFSLKQIEAEANDVSSSVQHSATRALSCMNEARHRSSSAEVPHCRDQAKGSRDDVVSESPQKKPKPQFCDSARKAFILRSKSADGGQEQLKHTHYLLHQKLITGQKPKLQPNPSPSGHSAPRKRTNLSNSHASSRTTLSTTERSPDLTVSTGSRSLENVHQLSPVAPSMKQSTVLQSPVTKVPTSDSVEESLYDHLPCSPQKQRRQDHHCDVSQMELRPPSPPRPPGRTTSLLLRSSSESSASQTHSSTTGTKTNDLCSVLETQKSSVMRDHQHTAPQRSAEDKPITSGPKVPSVPVQGAPESEQLSADRRATNDNQVPFILSSQSVLQRSQQSVSEPKLSEVLPAAFPNVYYLGISNNPQTSCSNAVKRTLPANAKSHEVITGQDTSTFLLFGRQNKDNGRSLQTFQTFTCDPQVIHECGAHDKAHRIETRCNSLDSDPVHPGSSDGSGVLDWGFDEQGWLFKRSVSVSTRPLLKPVMGMNGAKARSQSFGARYMDRPSFNRSGKVRTQIKTHSGSSLNSLGDVLPGSMSCSSSYHCPMNRSLLNNFLIEEGLTAPSHLGSSSERLQSLKFQREQARRLQIEQQFSSAFGEPVSEEPERQSTITTIEEKVMLGIEENLHKSQEQDRTSEVKQKSGSSLASWFGFRKSKLPASSSRKTDPPKVKEEKREQKITSLLGGKNTKSDKKRDRRKSDGKESSVGRRESHDAVRACISMPCPGMSMSEIQGHAHVVGEPKMQMMKRRADDEDGPTVKSPVPDTVIVCRQK